MGGAHRQPWSTLHRQRSVLRAPRGVLRPSNRGLWRRRRRRTGSRRDDGEEHCVDLVRNSVRLEVVRADHLRVVEKCLVADDSGGDSESLHRGIGRAVCYIGRDEDDGQDVVGDDLRERRGRVREEVLDERVGQALEGLQRRGRGRSCDVSLRRSA